ncbi:uncharacterized protein MELLADRAFT_85549 [Melampsora larici-populina 98AG31]|uniref:Uncharacterized protein n=1 Tax=Melampsora larici-populina (strain 98AG31 / pathotype 3-4-7) TaxID=747676 RepID=F4RJ52_MELLP|nr:uncharacterized protein MELLADRAFT_85549 [Melampsora larici-populina 98AG31]EGG07673.1 hypothetical protein MELLADRAFT_85549 [Melampsora larici-populina 98AG31]
MAIFFHIRVSQGGENCYNSRPLLPRQTLINFIPRLSILSKRHPIDMSSSSVSQANRRSTRPSPARKQSHMITLPRDSRRSYQRREDNDSESDVSVLTSTTARKKRKRTPSVIEDNGDDSESAVDSSLPPPIKKTSRQASRSSKIKEASKKTSRGSKTTSHSKKQSRLPTSSSVKLQIDLVQDSDEENRKVVKESQVVNDSDDDDRYGPVQDYYEEAKEGPKDVS